VSLIRRYLDGVAGQDWAAVSECLAVDVRRVGPFGDVYEGREQYLAFLRRTMPALAGYSMDVERVLHTGDENAAVAELTETVELDGRPVRTPESLVFDLDDDGRIRHIAIYIQQRPPATQ
jgi:ketosteroid isomerase-like protein